ncbi:MAG: Rne/Rng family ribonuclease [Leptolyngbyaceae bacterium]|nr:Rne/Rng family ribonuclease [Leptolyngbyaceae bacterium]
MPKQIVIAEQHRIAAVFSEDQIQELIVAQGTHQVGDIYVGTVENVLPSIDAAFVNIGDADRNGFIHVSDLGPLKLRRTAGSITELLAPQQKVLVQIMKEPTGNKGPRLTGNVSLPGRYLVLMPFGRGVNLSRRIRNENERNRLRALAILLKPAGMGLLVRTEAEGVSEEAIIEDLETLQRQWENIQQEAIATSPPSLLNRDDDFIQRVLRDVYSADVNSIVVDSHTGLKRVRQHLTAWNGGRSPQGVFIDHHRDRTPILEFFRVNAAIREALKPRVDLPSGGYVIIEPTEALTVVDVNSGSFTRSATARETVLWTNCEAAVEIARQLRLRNIAGVIIIDFIDMDSRRDQLQVLEQFNKALRADKARPQIAQLSELGLVELTRKRQGQNIYEIFGKKCPSCDGLGHLVHLPGEPEPVVSEGTETLTIPDPVVSVGRSRDLSRESSREVKDVPGYAEESELDHSSDLQSLDLLNHPSYQERNNGRRRRRRRTPELPPRNGSSRSERPTPTPSLPPQTDENGAIATREPRAEKSERRSRREKTPSQPPEVVVVEMTAQEQDVYALMGISPLALANTEVKEPKSVVVNVVLPGEGQAAMANLSTELANGEVSGVSLSSATDKTDPELELCPDPSEIDGANADVDVDADESITEVTPAPILRQQQSQETEQEMEVADDIGAELDDDEDSQSEADATRRRRRRRSSAS